MYSYCWNTFVLVFLYCDDKLHRPIAQAVYISIHFSQAHRSWGNFHSISCISRLFYLEETWVSAHENVGRLLQINTSSGLITALWDWAHTCVINYLCCVPIFAFCMVSLVAFIGISLILYIFYSSLLTCASFRRWWILMFKLISELKWYKAGVTLSAFTRTHTKYISSLTSAPGSQH